MFNRNHNIVRLIERFNLGGQTFLVTMLAGGGDLVKYCKQQPDPNLWMSESRAQHIVYQIAKGLQAIHKKRIVHRDIKLMNIFCCDSTDFPKIKIGDFGLAIKLAEGEKVVQKVETITFSAPEVIKKEAYDFKADVWSLGIIYYMLVSSLLPFGKF